MKVLSLLMSLSLMVFTGSLVCKRELLELRHRRADRVGAAARETGREAHSQAYPGGYPVNERPQSARAYQRSSAGVGFQSLAASQAAANNAQHPQVSAEASQEAYVANTEMSSVGSMIAGS